jgi:sugar (pentulose or hexulose) kinase
MTGRRQEAIVVGIDVGTTHTKALAASLEGQPLAIGSCPTAWDTRPDGGAEIPPQRLLEGAISACMEAIDRAGADVGAVRVVGVGVTGMAEAGVMLHADGSIPQPVIAWFDPRGGEEIAALDGAFAAAFPARTGLPLTPLATFSKLLWMTRTGLPRWSGARWLNVPEYLVAALGGEAVGEASLASRTGLIDQDTLAPYDDALAVLGASSELLPPLVPAGNPVGRVGERGPEALRGAVLTVAGHDHPVASLAAGALGEDDLFDSCGTAEAVIRVTRRRFTSGERVRLSGENITQGAHVVPGRRILLGGTRGGLLLRRTLALLGAEDGKVRAALEKSCPAGDVELPVRVEGGRIDEQDVVLHVTADGVTPALVWRAALDSVAEQAAALVAIFDSVVGPAERMVAAGGWTRSPSYRAIKSRTFPGIAFSSVQEPGALGAAAIAAFAAEGGHDVGDLPDFLSGLLGEPGA